MSLPDPNFWRGRRVLVTGHTGFTGGWLALWLAHFSAQVTGYALPPEHADGIFLAGDVARTITPVTGDLKDRSRLRHLIEIVRPEIIFHLAAQAQVGRGYRDPQGTYLTNIVGTSEVLEAARVAPSVRAVVVVTSDNVYENRDRGRPFRETDSLGGLDPYGVSKAAAEMAVTAFRQSLPAGAPAVATARAGNIVGGGDWGEDRLVPDAIRAFRLGAPLQVLNPNTTCAWQHVLDPLAGYLILAERLMTGEPQWRAAWNLSGTMSEPVHGVADRLVDLWSRSGIGHAAWQSAAAPDEAASPELDSSRARDLLGWEPRFLLGEALTWTLDWYIAQAFGEPMHDASVAMIDAYMGMPPAG